MIVRSVVEGDCCWLCELERVSALVANDLSNSKARNPKLVTSLISLRIVFNVGYCNIVIVSYTLILTYII